MLNSSVGAMRTTVISVAFARAPLTPVSIAERPFREVQDKGYCFQSCAISMEDATMKLRPNQSPREP
eukprot:10064582-Lingulodinium_polyedra.AAC.1